MTPLFPPLPTMRDETTALDAKTGLCLSIQQPWAWLIVNGFKDVENRNWPTRVRGWVGIHAGKKIDREGYDWVRHAFPQIDLPAVADLQLGGIIGRARIVDCVSESGSAWFFGEYGFVFDNFDPLNFTPCRGQLGFFRPAPAVPRTTP